MTSLTGSNTSHSRLAPSSAKMWSTCTAAPNFIDANTHRILPLRFAEVRKLTPYLQSIPAGEVFPHEWKAIDIVDSYFKGNLSLEEMSPEMIKTVEDSAGSNASREGVRAHEFAAAILLGQKTLEDIPAEFRPHVKVYVDHCNSIVGEDRFIEQKVKLFYSESDKDTGTCDHAVITKDSIHISDLKYGAGVKVDPEENEQFAIYALSFVEEHDLFYDFDPATLIHMTVVQPRHHGDDPVRTWTITLAELRNFCRDIEQAAIQIREGRDLRFSPGTEQCRWCPCKLFCDARAKAVFEPFDLPDLDGRDILAGMPDLDKDEKKQPAEERVMIRLDKLADITSPGVGAYLDDETLVKIWGHTKQIEAFLGDIDELINDRALSGHDFGGLVKLVKGRDGNTAWKDEDEADRFCQNQKLKQEERYSFKLKSPTQIKELIADRLEKTKRTATRFAELTTRSPGKTVAAPIGDKRPAVPSPLSDMPDEPDLEDLG